MMKYKKRYVIGDIHGNYNALLQVLSKVKFDYSNDLLIILGDIVDGYSCSYQVVEEILKMKNKVFVIGNHDVWFMNYMANGWSAYIWLAQGGENTLNSYKNEGYSYKKLPKDHKEFFNSGVYYYELDNVLFVHGGFDYPMMPKDCSIENLTWDRNLIERMKNGLKIEEYKTIFVGHTSTENYGAKPLCIDYYDSKHARLINIDCGAGWNGRLCLWDIDTDNYVLSDYARELNKEGDGR